MNNYVIGQRYHRKLMFNNHFDRHCVPDRRTTRHLGAIKIIRDTFLCFQGLYKVAIQMKDELEINCFKCL